MKENKNVINILRNVKEMHVKGDLVRKYNPKEENHEIFYVFNNDIIDETAYKSLTVEDQNSVETVNIMSSFKKTDNHPTVMITSVINIFLLESLEIDKTEVIEEIVGTLRMIDIIELVNVFNHELDMKIDLDPKAIIDITNLVPDIQAKIKGEFPEYLQATEILYKKEKITSLLNLNQKFIEGEAEETNKFVLKELEVSEPIGVYLYAGVSEEETGEVIVDIVTDSELWSMNMSREIKTGKTTPPTIDYAEYLRQNESVRKIKTLYFLASIAALEGEVIMQQLPNILKFF